MARPSVWFEPGEWEWVDERESIGFTGHTEMGPVELLITSEALVELLDPSRDAMDRETAIETFIEFESDIHRIALREFVSRLGGEPPILLTSADVAS
ncbi:DUF1488 family protein [Microvirga sp. SRT01]|uniref:DUF1488 family protein n=1 Tax=Sphingomonas longa TaxID=2778730 RepID=A0ABS2DA82_9SPHN|nr:DUF1488 family protein [Microvirga sp. SRT01]MBM6577798.1 DUF1488 family protein [Sphingomonas sp. BT552]MBR7710840.1 DUF1488 family protein [Microvirga sp. SRT01]